MFSRQIPVHETFLIGAMLAVVGGYLDAYTYLIRGGVFANAQTGNIVLLAINFANGSIRKAVYYVVPVMAFVLGVIVSEYLKRKLKGNNYFIWEHIVILVEVILLLGVGFLPEQIPDGVVNVTVSFICSLQVNSFRKVGNVPYASTMCTGNLRSGSEAAYRYWLEKDLKEKQHALHYFGIIVCFIAGAMVGTYLTDVIGVRSVWVCSAILFVVFSIMTVKRSQS